MVYTALRKRSKRGRSQGRIQKPAARQNAGEGQNAEGNQSEKEIQSEEDNQSAGKNQTAGGSQTETHSPVVGKQRYNARRI